eukprot:CAMPEP_0201692890 /NCGR_PEP_ID=MMETSP0578-20130828/5653_1 /ASSEMBLY_ACC=CAM_ASM_000663 /TAXON_ID=267565 /ORGANISM="Skeletonema grethea, Strain CCMP 1804" /LENGTH=772 /DNA_ID=CAMNT_0048178339 /DNA_START=170 /DNA_END=2488 /DNA_ORIENTATION=-
MFQKFKQAITPPRGKKSHPTEDESTSLLASSSAPPVGASPSTEDRLFQPPPPQLEPMSIEEMEKGAKRLISDSIGDSDSVNKLLKSDSMSSFSMHGSGDSITGGDGENYGGETSLLTEDDLNYLTASTSLEKDATQQTVVVIQQQQQQRAMSGPRRRPSTRRMVDEIGDQLLEAQGNARLEHDILRKSLNLDAGNIAAMLLQQQDNDNKENVEEMMEQKGQILERIQESTRKMRTASFDGPPDIEREDLLDYEEQRKRVLRQVLTMVGVTVILILLVCVALALGTIAVGPPRQPVGPYKIIEAQVGHDFWQYYDFYAGKDSAGSNGHIMYVSEQAAREEGIVEVVTETVGLEDMIQIYEDGDPRAEEDWLKEDLVFLDQLKRKKLEDEKEEEAVEKKKSEKHDKEKTNDDTDSSGSSEQAEQANDSVTKEKKANRLLDVGDPLQEQAQLKQQVEMKEMKPPRLEPFNPDQASDVPEETFVVMSSTPTPEGPRNSVRLEGRRRFNRGLFIIDLRHMPAGCGTWPAFWLTDEANWPVNGEIDIVEGVNYQDTAKTALHTTKVCRMDDVPEGSKTGTWDTAVGIPDKKTGIPDMTFRYAQDCFVYDPHQWLNQGCVASDLKTEGRSLGVPLNQNGGGVYALEWDPVYKHIKTWVFSPHGRVPSNLRDALRTATNEDLSTRVAPDTNQWGLPYGHFPIGDGTNCPSGHFRNMRLVINLAFCGSVAGNRYFMDCPKQFKKFKTCNEWVESNPDELKEAYWKIRGVYVYEREWQKQWS